MGADYLEQDVVATRDDELIVLHDIHLDRVTNIASEFPDRCLGVMRQAAQRRPVSSKESQPVGRRRMLGEEIVQQRQVFFNLS